MKKLDQRELKRAKNEAFADKHKKSDRDALRKQRKMDKIDKAKAFDVWFWKEEAKRRAWPEGQRIVH